MTIVQDVRHAVRSLLKAPALTLAAVLSLGLGIGANTTIFTWVQAVLLRPIPGAANAGSIYVAALENRGGDSRSWSYPNYRDFRDRATLVEMVAQDDLVLSIGVNGQGERAWGGRVSGNFFQVMGVGAAAGRVLTPEDDRNPSGHPVIVISHAYWMSRFGGDPGVVGRAVTVNTLPFTVIGVAQEGFIGSFLGLATSAWVPMAMQPQMTGASRLEARGNGWMQAFARLKPGATREQANAELSGILAQIQAEHKDSFEGWRVKAVNTWEASFGAPSVLAPVLGVLSIVVVLVLVIACANVANLLLARAVGRRREVAIRLSLGANRGRLIRQLLTESILLALVSGAVGMAMVFWTAGLLMAFVPPVDLPVQLALGVDSSTFTFALGISVLTGVVFGLAPAWQASSPDTVHALKEETRGSSGRTGHRLRSGLVVSQVAVCFVLLVGAVLFVRSLGAAQSIDPGFDVDRQMSVAMDLFPSGYTPESGRVFRRQLAERVAALPGVESVAFARQLPLGFSGRSSMGVNIDGYTPQEGEEVVINYNMVSARYFETMGIPIVSGREFNTADQRDAPDALVINETMARRYWKDRGPVGSTVRIGPDTYTVVGVARDIKYQSLSERPLPHLYLNLEQAYASSALLQVRTANPAAMTSQVREVIRSMDPTLPVFDARPVSEYMEQAFFAQRIGANLLGAMGALALLLAAVGLYGVMAYAVSQRTQEMGIRLALGAQPGDILRMVIGQGARLIAVGLVIGLALAFGVTRFMASLLPGISPSDPVSFALVPVTLIATALLAAWIPARKAGKTDPVVALRYE